MNYKKYKMGNNWINSLQEYFKDDLKESNFENKGILEMQERKTLSVVSRMKIAENISSQFSLLNTDKGIFREQLFCAMEMYLKQCNETGFNFKG